MKYIKKRYYSGVRSQNIIPELEKSFNVKIVKHLGESIGIAYLTSDNKILKLTPSDAEISICKRLIKHPNNYFSKVYIMEKIDADWVAILKEFVPKLPTKIRKQYLNLEAEVNEWCEDTVDNELMSHKILDTKGTLFIDYLKDCEPNLVKLYSDLISIIDYAAPLVVNNIVDIHVDDFGWNGNNLVLFDY